MASLQLSAALVTNDRSRAIIDGTVQAEGIDLTVTVSRTLGEIFWRQLHFKEFDVAEMSLGEMLMLVSRGERSWVMLPVFMTRRFFHTEVLVRAGAGIEQPTELRGKRIGVPEYIMTGALWARGVLKDEFGVSPEDLDWYQERSGAMSHGSTFGLKSPTRHFQYIPSEKTIGTMILADELDAVMLYTGIQNVVDRSTVNLRQQPSIRSLFPDTRAEVLRYYQKTGIYPVNHGVVIRRSIFEQHPWVALNLYQAFVAAKKEAASRSTELADACANLGWLTPDARAVLNKDPFPYGAKTNQLALETCARYSADQGLSSRLVKLEEVFADSTLDF